MQAFMIIFIHGLMANPSIYRAGQAVFAQGGGGEKSAPVT